MARVLHARNRLAPNDALINIFGDVDNEDVVEEPTAWITDTPALPLIPIFYNPSRMTSLLQEIYAGRLPGALESAPVLDHCPDDIVQAFRGVVDVDKLEEFNLTSCLATIAYEKHGRIKDVPLAAVHVFVGLPFHTSADAILDFGERVRGGELRAIVVHGLLDTPRSPDVGFAFARIHLKVRGRNPSKRAVRAEIARLARTLDDALKLQIIAFVESQFHQFFEPSYPSKSGDEPGEPVFGGQVAKGLPRIGGAPPPLTKDRGGFGIMQIDTPPPTAEEIWHWKKNLARGAKIFYEKRALALDHLHKLERENPAAPVVASTVYGLTKFTPAQIDIEIYQSYNSAPYWARFSTSAGQWEVTTTSRDRGYGPYCHAIQSRILDGLGVPRGWD